VMQKSLYVRWLYRPILNFLSAGEKDAHLCAFSIYPGLPTDYAVTFSHLQAYIHTGFEREDTFLTTNCSFLH
jgi:hypothetical protein